MTVKIGLGLFTGQIPPGSDRSFVTEYHDIVALGRLAETLGFDSVWVSEHHGSSDGYMPSLLPVLGALAAATDRVLLGTGVILAPFHHPLRLAEDAATVDLLSGGRVLLGLGLGWREEEFRMFGIPVSERLSRTTEAVDILRQAWTGKRFSHQGKVFRFDDVLITPAPERQPGPSIYLGGFVEAAVKRAGRLADGYIRSRAGLDEAKEALAWAEAGALDAGRDPSTLGFAFLQNTFVWDEGDAWEVVGPGVAHQMGTYAGWRAGTDTPERPDLDVAPLDDEMLRAMTPAGDPHTVLRALTPIVKAFAAREEFHLICRLHYPGMDLDTAGRAVELFGTEVLPALKGS